MQTANNILQAIQKLGERKEPLTRIYRSLFSENLYLAAYNKIYRNEGALTPGTEDDTVDGMNMNRIRNLIEQLRYEHFKFRPSRRTYIKKAKGGTRPLGIPNFSEKLVQEVLRMVLEAYYEPRFRTSSHGFRPGRGCHTALAQIKMKFVGTTWFIEGDIRGCFDNIDHDVLMEILARDIKDGRLLNLIRMGLKAGYMEDWKYHQTYSGTPQGGVLSPILANIYLNELDTFIEDELIPRYTRGTKRKMNPEYQRIQRRLELVREKGKTEKIKVLSRELYQLPSFNTRDPDFRRLNYVRYADDFILGYIGSKEEAETIKAEIHNFLAGRLHLELSETKTLITHAKTEFARFLGYAVSVHLVNDKLGTGKKRVGRYTGQQRSLNGIVRLGIPYGLVDNYCQKYLRNGKIIGDSIIVHNSDAHIIDTYQQRYRGVAEYYKYAVDRGQLSKLRYVMEVSLVKTLAHKFKVRATRIMARYRGTQSIGNVSYKTLQVEVPTQKGSRTVYWGAISLRVIKMMKQPLDDKRYQEWWTVRSDLIKRLQADKCELCGSNEDVEVHHIRKLADLKKNRAGRNLPLWVFKMAAVNRKTLVVCRNCHEEIHRKGSPKP